MNRAKLVSTGRFPLTSDFKLWEQSIEQYENFLNKLGVPNCVLSGCAIVNVGGGNFLFSSGYIFFNNKIHVFDEQTHESDTLELVASTVGSDLREDVNGTEQEAIETLKMVELAEGVGFTLDVDTPEVEDYIGKLTFDSGWLDASVTGSPIGVTISVKCRQLGRAVQIVVDSVSVAASGFTQIEIVLPTGVDDISQDIKGFGGFDLPYRVNSVAGETAALVDFQLAGNDSFLITIHAGTTLKASFTYTTD